MYIYFSIGNNSGLRTLVCIVEVSVKGGVRFRRFHCNQFLIKLVKMWPGGIPHVVVRTLKIDLKTKKKHKKKFNRVLSCQ